MTIFNCNSEQWLSILVDNFLFKLAYYDDFLELMCFIFKYRTCGKYKMKLLLLN